MVRPLLFFARSANPFFLPFYGAVQPMTVKFAVIRCPFWHFGGTVFVTLRFSPPNSAFYASKKPVLTLLNRGVASAVSVSWKRDTGRYVLKVRVFHLGKRLWGYSGREDNYTIVRVLKDFMF